MIKGTINYTIYQQKLSLKLAFCSTNRVVLQFSNVCKSNLSETIDWLSIQKCYWVPFKSELTFGKKLSIFCLINNKYKTIFFLKEGVSMITKEYRWSQEFRMTLKKKIKNFLGIHRELLILYG